MMLKTSCMAGLRAKALCPPGHLQLRHVSTRLQARPRPYSCPHVSKADKTNRKPASRTHRQVPREFAHMAEVATAGASSLTHALHLVPCPAPCKDQGVHQPIYKLLTQAVPHTATGWPIT